jgi:AcrR family transcriptional regulator
MSNAARPGPRASSPAVAEAPAGKRERTRTALIEAAIEVLAEKGLEGTSIDDLMRVAGMARGTFYNYFQTREEVVGAVITYLKDKLRAAVVEQIPPEYGSEATVACSIYGFIKFGKDNPKMGWALVRIGGDSQWVSGEKFQRCESALEGVLGDDIQPVPGLAYIDGIILMLLRRVLEDRITAAEAEQVLVLAFRGLGIHSAKIKSMMNTAKKFVESLSG